MNKTDKELATEITVAMITSNPRVISAINGNVTSGVSLGIAQSIFKGIYETIHSEKD